MPATTEPLFPMNQTSSFIDTSTGCDNFTYGNYSGNGSTQTNEPVLNMWSDFQKYKHIFWGILLCITVIGTTGNILVFIMMGDKKLSSLSYSVYLKFLAVSDSCLLISTLLYESGKMYFLGQFVEIVITMCLLPFGLRIASLWLVVGLTVDRYACVCFPLKREIICNRKKAIVFCSSLFGLGFVLMIPFFFNMTIVGGQCFTSKETENYFIFVQVVFSSAIPCMAILVLNILIIVQIQRSRNFRNTFTSTANSASCKQDSSTRPLVLVSVLAFVTMFPETLMHATVSTMVRLDADVKYLTFLTNIWLSSYLIYMLNFGQNFYILIGSSSNYRQIIKKRLSCYTSKQNHTNHLHRSVMTNIPSNSSGSGFGTTGVSLESITSGVRN